MTLSKIKSSSMADNTIHGRRNLITNGAVSVNQRGNSTGVVADGYYGPDRWHYKTEGEETVSISQASDGPDGFSNSYKVEVTTEDSTIGADDYARIETRLEGQNLQHLKYGASGAESITLSFYVKSSVTGTYAVGFYSADGSRNIGSTYTISSANTWEYKTLTFAGDTGGTLNDDNGEALRIWFLLSSGSNFASSDNTSWAGYSDSRVAYGHTANVIGTANATFFITGVQLEVGSQATPFEHRSFGEELALCQRYYYRITCVGNNTVVANGFQMAALTTSQFTIYPKVTLRAVPSIGFLNLKVGDHTSYLANVSSFSSVSTGIIDVVQVTAVHASGGASFRPATLQGNNSTTDNFIELKCEL